MKHNYTLKKNLKYLFVFLIINFMGVKSFSQTINFTIDTVLDNNTSYMTEAIVNGIDTYVLTIDHPGDESIHNLGGGDQIFFSGGSFPSDPFILSLTKNGIPYGFTLNSLDYDTVVAGTISLKNQDDLIIAAGIEYPVGAGSIVISNPANAVDISNFKITPLTSAELNNFGFHNVNITIGSVLGIDDLDLNNQVLIYPNPSSGRIAINSLGTILQNIQVFDLKGLVVANYKLDGLTNSKEMNLSELSSGVYLVNINSDKGSIVKRLIIK